MESQLFHHIGRGRSYALIAVALVVLFTSAPMAHAQIFDSGSNGSDGALNLTTPGTIEFDPKSFNPPLDTDGDNIYHFTTINIAAGVTVRLTARKINGPVFWLASGAVQVDGTINLDGEPGYTVSTNFVRAPSVPGAGGYPGGVGSLGDVPAQPGAGPGGGLGSLPNSRNGGGAGHATPGQDRRGREGAAYGNSFLVPLIGGSGGGGGSGQSSFAGNGGGPGGGAILVASSVSISITGTITAKGGDIGGSGDGGTGSSGAIRLVAPIITGTGKLEAPQQNFDSTCGGCGGAAGRIRLEAFQQNFTGTNNPLAAKASPFALFLPTSQPSVRAVSVDGVPVPSTPTGSFTVPDVGINKSSPVVVNIAAKNVPPGTVVKLLIFSENGPDQTIDSTALVGTLASSTATASVVFPSGFSRGFVQAKWANQ